MKKRTKKLHISVGIAAYNEEKNIRRVLQDILGQKQEGWKLKEVVVYDDGSSDNTVGEVAKVKSKYVRLVSDRQRRGKTHRLSQMFQDFTGDILVMFDGDIEFADEHVITNMAKPFGNCMVMLAGGNSTPLPPASFFQRAVYSTFRVFYRSRLAVRKGHNIFGCTGSILAIRRHLARSIRFPQIMNEDAYIYLECIRRGFLFRYADNAVIHYTLPSHLNDYLRQAFRSHPEAVDVELKPYFGGLVDREFARPRRFYVGAVMKTFAEYPLEVIFISAVHVLCKPFYGIVTSRYKLSWFTASSTH